MLMCEVERNIGELRGQRGSRCLDTYSLILEHFLDLFAASLLTLEHMATGRPIGFQESIKPPSLYSNSGILPLFIYMGVFFLPLTHSHASVPPLCSQTVIKSYAAKSRAALLPFIYRYQLSKPGIFLFSCSFFMYTYIFFLSY